MWPASTGGRLQSRSSHPSLGSLHVPSFSPLPLCPSSPFVPATPTPNSLACESASDDIPPKATARADLHSVKMDRTLRSSQRPAAAKVGRSGGDYIGIHCCLTNGLKIEQLRTTGIYHLTQSRRVRNQGQLIWWFWLRGAPVGEVRVSARGPQAPAGWAGAEGPVPRQVPRRAGPSQGGSLASRRLEAPVLAM